MGFEILPPVQNETWKYTVKNDDKFISDVRVLLSYCKTISQFGFIKQYPNFEIEVKRLLTAAKSINRHLKEIESNR